MSLLSIAQTVGLDVGLFGTSVPTSFIGTGDRDTAEMLSYINAAGEEINRRVDWTGTRKSTTLVGTGARITFTLPADFSRLIMGKSVSYAGAAVRGGLSEDEWDALPFSAGAPRFFKLSGRTIEFFPFLALNDTVTVRFQSLNWNGSKAYYELDNEVALIPETVITKAAIARWRRQKGMEYESRAAEYEQAIQDFAKFDEGIRSP